MFSYNGKRINAKTGTEGLFCIFALPRGMRKTSPFFASNEKKGTGEISHS